jgi:hypothetical protein
LAHGTKGGLALIALSALLVNAALMLARAPPVFASACSSTGGDGGTAWYYAGWKDTDTSSAYGVGADASPAAWKFNTGDTQSHMDLWVTQGYPLDSSWAQTGYTNGTSPLGTYTSRYIYFEFGYNSNPISGAGGVASSYPIPNNDDGELEAWTYSVNGNGMYVAEGEAYSYAYNLYFVSSHTMTIFDEYGPASTALEAWYSTSGLTCDSFGTSSSYSGTGEQVYTTSVSTSQPLSVGTDWSTCTLDPSTSNSPYSTAQNISGDCYAVLEYYGG